MTGKGTTVLDPFLTLNLFIKGVMRGCGLSERTALADNQLVGQELFGTLFSSP
jgi:hypothetical protein